MNDKLKTYGFNNVVLSLTDYTFTPANPHTPTAGEQGRRLFYRYF